MTSKPPLIDLFLYLRDQAGLPLTIDQYFLLLEATLKGFGLSNQQQLKQVCQMLWIKGNNSRELHLFDQYFERYFQQFKKTIQPDQTTVTHRLNSPPDKPEKLTNQKTPSETIINDKPSETIPKLPQFIPRALRIPLLTETRFTETKFKLFLTDFPITERKINRNFSLLRQLIREGAKTEIDLDATIELICKDGFFLKPVLQSTMINRLEIIWLIDISESMLPFEPIIKNLLTTIHDYNFGKIDYYYFYNCPEDYLYLDQSAAEPQLISNILPHFHRQRTVIFILTDGGAARGGFNQDRLKLTEDFINLWSDQVRHLLWLNPLPEDRWEGTTAQEIANLIEMVSLTDRGLKRGVKLLRK